MLTKRVAMIRTSSTSRFKKRLRAKAAIALASANCGDIRVGELGDQLPASAGDELRGSASGRDENRGLAIKLGRQPEEITIERSA